MTIIENDYNYNFKEKINQISNIVLNNPKNVSRDILNYIKKNKSSFSPKVLSIAYYMIACLNKKIIKTEFLKKSLDEKIKVSENSKICLESFVLSCKNPKKNKINDLIEKNSEAICEIGHSYVYCAIDNRDNNDYINAYSNLTKALLCYKDINNIDYINSTNKLLIFVLNEINKKDKTKFNADICYLSEAVIHYNKRLRFLKKIYYCLALNNEEDKGKEIVSNISYSNFNLFDSYVKLKLYDGALSHCMDDLILSLKTFNGINSNEYITKSFENIAICINKIGIKQMDEKFKILEIVCSNVLKESIDFTDLSSEAIIEILLSVVLIVQDNSKGIAPKNLSFI